MKKKQIIQNVCMYMAAVGMLVGSAVSVSATKIYVDSTWTTIADGDETDLIDGGYVGPGYGGQLFDAEYLAYKWEAATGMLSIGLQSGFDLSDGIQKYGTKKYYAGDLALSFDGDSSYYEYAVDFGFKITKDFDLNKVGYQGADNAGVWKVDSTNGWSDGAFPNGHDVSVPFAMNLGKKRAELIDNELDPNSNDTSYFRYVSFNVGDLGLTPGDYQFDAHWTMSCGNDAINGSGGPVTAHAPEPSTMLLFGTGLIGLAGVTRRRSSKK